MANNLSEDRLTRFISAGISKEADVPVGMKIMMAL